MSPRDTHPRLVGSSTRGSMYTRNAIKPAATAARGAPIERSRAIGMGLVIAAYNTSTQCRKIPEDAFARRVGPATEGAVSGYTQAGAGAGRPRRLGSGPRFRFRHRTAQPAHAVP